MAGVSSPLDLIRTSNSACRQIISSFAARQCFTMEVFTNQTIRCPLDIMAQGKYQYRTNPSTIDRSKNTTRFSSGGFEDAKMGYMPGAGKEQADIRNNPDVTRKACSGRCRYQQTPG